MNREHHRFPITTYLLFVSLEKVILPPLCSLPAVCSTRLHVVSPSQLFQSHSSCQTIPVVSRLVAAEILLPRHRHSNNKKRLVRHGDTLNLLPG